MEKSVDRERKYNFCNWVSEGRLSWVWMKIKFIDGEKVLIEYNQIIYGTISFFNEIILRK